MTPESESQSEARSEDVNDAPTQSQTPANIVRRFAASMTFRTVTRAPFTPSRAQVTNVADTGAHARTTSSTFQPIAPAVENI